MKKSKISRSLVVAIFIAMIIFLSYINIKLMIHDTNNSDVKTSLIFKIGYAIILVFLVLLYMFIKAKLYRMKIKRINSLIYRNIYLFVLVLFAKIFTLKYSLENFLSISCILTLILNIATAFILKRIIFNISKSDVLSVIAMVLYSTFLNAYLDEEMLLISSILQILIFSSIWLIQVLIDELKQKGIRTKKYLKIAISIGIIASLTTLFGINKIVWYAVFIVLLFITVDLDNTHLTFPKKFVYSFSNEKRDKLYKIETFNISKILISSIVIIAIIILLNHAFVWIFNDVLSTDDTSNYTMSYIKTVLNAKFDGALISSNIEKLLNLSKMYNFVLFMYILLIEFLSIILRRKYDTKTTMLKTLFILIITTICIINIDVIYFQSIISTLLIIISIVNTSSIYLNREERIKLLVA